MCPANTERGTGWGSKAGRITTPGEDYRTGFCLFDSPDLGARYADERAVLSDAPSGVFDSPDAGVGQIVMIGRPSAGRCASAQAKKHNNKQSKGYKSRPKFGGSGNAPH